MKSYRALLKKYLSEFISAFRKVQHISQQDMAAKLHISTRAYGDLERGRYCFSVVPLLFLLLMLDSEGRKAFLEEFNKRVDTLDGKEGT